MSDKISLINGGKDKHEKSLRDETVKGLGDVCTLVKHHKHPPIAVLVTVMFEDGDVRNIHIAQTAANGLALVGMLEGHKQALFKEFMRGR